MIIDKEITTDDKFRDNSKYFFIEDLVKLQVEQREKSFLFFFDRAKGKILTINIHSITFDKFL